MKWNCWAVDVNPKWAEWIASPHLADGPSIGGDAMLCGQLQRFTRFTEIYASLLTHTLTTVTLESVWHTKEYIDTFSWEL